MREAAPKVTIQGRGTLIAEIIFETRIGSATSHWNSLWTAQLSKFHRKYKLLKMNTTMQNYNGRNPPLS